MLARANKTAPATDAALVICCQNSNWNGRTTLEGPGREVEQFDQYGHLGYLGPLRHLGGRNGRLGRLGPGAHMGHRQGDRGRSGKNAENE